MDENARKQMLFEENRKSIGVAYLLWLFFGVFSAHRFYAGQTKSGVVRLIMLLVPVIGWALLTLLWIVDLFLIPSMINEQNMKTIALLNAGDSGPVRPSADSDEGREIEVELDARRQAMLEELRATGYRKERRQLDRIYR